MVINAIVFKLCESVLKYITVVLRSEMKRFGYQEGVLFKTYIHTIWYSICITSSIYCSIRYAMMEKYS